MLHSCNIPFIIFIKNDEKRNSICQKRYQNKKKEDYLSLMYEMKRKENQIVKSDLSRELEVPLSRVTRVTDGLLEEGYLLKDEGRRMFLTPMGLSKGQQCLERKRCLTEFLRLVSGVDGSIAKKKCMCDRTCSG